MDPQPEIPNPDETANADGGATEEGTEKPVEEKPPTEPEKKEPVEPEVPERPEMVEKWKVEDFQSAKREGDRRLNEAIESMAERFAGDARAAGLFKSLLLREKLPGDKLPDGSEGPEKIIEIPIQTAITLLDSLGKNKTPEGTAVLKEVLVGKLDTPITGLRGVNAVVDTLIKHADYIENENLIFGLVTASEATIGGSVIGGEDAIPVNRFQSNLINSLNRKLTQSLSLRLAKHLEDPQVSKELATQLETILLPDFPETLPAKLVLFQNSQAERRTKSSIESTLIAHSEVAISILLGIPPKLEELPTPGTVSRPTQRQPGYDEDVIQQEMQFAELCWTPELLTFLNDQFKQASSPDQVPGLIQLIADTPTPLARFYMSEMMSYHAYAGPKYWTGANLFGRAVHDPALVVMSKQIYHSSSRRVTRVDKNDMRPTVDQSARDQWRDAMEPLIQAWIKRMYSAAKFADPEEQSALRGKGNFNITLHPKANVVAEYHLVWPGTAQAQVPGVNLAPLEIHYIRMEEEAALVDRITTHYKRFGGGINSPDHKVRNGFWYDDLTNGSTPKSKRSVDIMMSHKPIVEEKPIPGVINEPKPIPLSVDILTIEIPEVVDPRENK